MYPYTNYKDGCKRLRRLLIMDKLINGLLILVALIGVTSVVFFFIFQGQEAMRWAAEISCGVSIVLCILFFKLLAVWFDSDDKIRRAKGEKLQTEEDD